MAKKVTIEAKDKPVEANTTATTIKSSLKGSTTTTSVTNPTTTTSNIQFRIFVGSYEHNLLCVSLILDPTGAKEPVFQPIFHFQAHSLSIKSIDLAKRYLVTGSNDEHIRIYDLQKRKELGHLLSHNGTITTLKFSSEGHDDPKETVDKSGKWLLSGSEDGKIIIWRTKDWETFGILKGHTGRINDLAIHPSGKVAISVSQDQTIRLWNLMTAKKAAVLKIKGRDHLGQSGSFVRWSLDGNYFVVGLLNQLLVYKTSSAKIVKKVKLSTSLMCIDIILVEDKEWLVVGLGNGVIEFYDFQKQVVQAIEDDEEKVLDSKPEQLTSEFELRGHTNRIKGMTYYTEQEVPLLISVSSDGKIVVWNLTKDVRDQVAIYDTGERLNCVVASPESIEKMDTMKRRFTSLEDMRGEEDLGGVSESEYETDGEEIQRIMKGKKKNKKKSKRTKVSVTLE
ncbi:Protein MAK11 [Spathaspora sp. JA1]|nr:Protein MAK11 [Spathaspora sp. JA1]